MSDLSIAPVTGGVGTWYSVSTVSLTSFVDTTPRTVIVDTVTLSGAAREYVTRTAAPGPDLSQAATELGAGTVISFIPGDYSGAVLVGQNLEGAVFNSASLQDTSFSDAAPQGTPSVDSSVQSAQANMASYGGASLGIAPPGQQIDMWV
jgi:uncharacterized protein YjbI with pentapeptide repeats